MGLPKVLEKGGYHKIWLSDDVAVGNGFDARAQFDKFKLDVEGKRVLDVGCFHGAFLIEAVRRGAVEAVGINRSADQLRTARELLAFADHEFPGAKYGEKIRFVHGDMIHMDTLLSDQYDLVLFMSVLHWIQEPRKAVRLIREAVAPGGAALIEQQMAPMGQTKKVFVKIDHYPDVLGDRVAGSPWGLGYYPTHEAMRELLLSSGFATVKWIGSFKSPTRAMYVCRP